jgi:hypothetical protein
MPLLDPLPTILDLDEIEKALLCIFQMEEKSLPNISLFKIAKEDRHYQCFPCWRSR